MNIILFKRNPKRFVSFALKIIPPNEINRLIRKTDIENACNEMQ